MLRLIGCAMLLCSSTALGFGAANILKERANELADLISSLRMAELEISERKTPLQKLLGKAASETTGKVNLFFTLCESRLRKGEDDEFSKIWTEAADAAEMHISQQENMILCSVGNVLGRYDADSQCYVLKTAREELISAHEEAKELSARMGRVYRMLGLTAGSVLAIVFI